MYQLIKKRLDKGKVKVQEDKVCKDKLYQMEELHNKHKISTKTLVEIVQI
jgi:hypothetical protein